MLWEPAIYEHKAALIGRGVSDVARDADMLVEALVKEYEVYRADYLTVGVDVYNIEAEACGGEVVAEGPDVCPDIPRPPWSLSVLPRQLEPPDIPASGRFNVLLEAGRKVADKLSSKCRVRIAASGPLSIAAKLVGTQDLITGLALQDENAIRLLRFTTEMAIAWCACLRREGLDVVLFDSTAAPPMLSPDMYADHAAPAHTRLMDSLRTTGQDVRPLIIGGDTTEIVSAMVASGATMIICDFPADAAVFASRLDPQSDTIVRRNVNPQVLDQGRDAIQRGARALARDLRCFNHPVAGTGILPYHFDPATYWELRKTVEAPSQESSV